LGKGRKLSEGDIARDVKLLLSKNFKELIAR